MDRHGSSRPRHVGGRLRQHHDVETLSQQQLTLLGPLHPSKFQLPTRTADGLDGTAEEAEHLGLGVGACGRFDGCGHHPWHPQHFLG